MVKSLEQHFHEAIFEGREFEKLAHLKSFFSKNPLNIKEINYCLDIYNSLKEEQQDYYAKFNALKLTYARLEE